jgi:hypothetical protein
MRFRGPAIRTRDEDKNRRLVATFPGENYVAEREGGELRIYLIGDADDLAPLVAGSTRDSGRTEPQRLRALNDYYRRFYGGDAA